MACGPSVGANGTDDGATSSRSPQGTTSSSGESSDVSSSGAIADSSSTSAGSTSVGSSSTGASGLGEGEHCNDLEQDCANGLKCVRVDLDGDFDDERICVPVLGDGADGDPCTRDPATAHDSCSATTFCSPRRREDDVGKCIDFCIPGGFVCADEDDRCVGSSSQGEYGCFSSCDPLAPDCGPSEYCTGAYPNAGFACYPGWADPNVTTGDACTGDPKGCPNGNCLVCASGYACLDVPLYGPGCDDPNDYGCCSEYCDLDIGECSNPLHECRPLGRLVNFGSKEGVGVCALPEGFEWCTNAPDEAPAGYCPPQGVEPNIPWCSPFNTDACPGDAINPGCWCVMSCEDASTCPVPQTGSADVVCDPDVGCSLLCGGDEDCPDGMDCFFAQGELRCVWMD